MAWGRNSYFLRPPTYESTMEAAIFGAFVALSAPPRRGYANESPNWVVVAEAARHIEAARNSATVLRLGRIAGLGIR